MNSVLKVVLLAIYASAILSFFIPLPFDASRWIRIVAAVALVAHALEAVVAFRHVRLYPGSLGMSLLLTLLFGFLHWKPLADAHKASAGA